MYLYKMFAGMWVYKTTNMKRKFYIIKRGKKWFLADRGSELNTIPTEPIFKTMKEAIKAAPHIKFKIQKETTNAKDRKAY